ncbi:MAG TPA: DUF3145 domain-containing protein [Microbacteriaceae bacterium]|nr:DUF3145 domain-containing protein [Microbacteriaceae bacterium]
MTVVAHGVLYVHSAPHAICPHVEWAAGRVLGRAIHFDWADQPALRGTRRAEFRWDGAPGAGATLASALRGWHDVRYEVTEDATAGMDGGRWLHTPRLGVFFAQTDSVGNVVVPEDLLRHAMEGAGMNGAELRRRLEGALGQAWDDELEPFRYAGDACRSLRVLHRVVG